MPLRNYYLGCPAWGIKTWVGRLFAEGTKPTEFLARYAEVFNTVEGNTTFYALPAPETVARWRDSVPDHFRFCFKFPRTITHDKLLRDCAAEVATFLDRVAPLGDTLGTLFLQLPPRFGVQQLPWLRELLGQLPSGYHYAVELRHDAFFAGGAEEAVAVAMLRELGADMVLMDTRGIHASTSLEHAETRAKKPNLPVLTHATASRPFVRCVPHERFAESRAHAEGWARQVAAWIAEGKTPYFFMHAPDDTFAPENAYAFHAMVREHADVGELPPWPASVRQLTLF